LKSSTPQTRSFTTVFVAEMWERFGFYGMAALLVLFMVDELGFTDSRANLAWGAFTALVYASPSIGGWIGDKILGARRTMVFGALVLCFGYLMLALPNDRLEFIYASLGVIVVGNGLFKANAANLMRRIYEGDDARIDTAFTIYYMAVNIGSTVSMLATPWIGMIQATKVRSSANFCHSLSPNGWPSMADPCRTRMSPVDAQGTFKSAGSGRSTGRRCAIGAQNDTACRRRSKTRRRTCIASPTCVG
jgi:dipeptide/tripeptide permease